MRLNVSRQLLIATTLIALVGCDRSPAKPAGGQASAAKSISIAGNLPLTGPIAMFCGKYPNGFLLGLDEACAEQGVPRDRFATDFQDNAGQNTTSVTVMQRQLQADPQLYISGTSAMSDAILPEVTKRSIPHLLVAFDAFMTQGNPNIIRILPNFKIEAPLFVDYAKRKKAKRVFCFTPNLKAYLEQSDRLILPGLRGAGMEVQRELFEFEQKEYRAIVQKADQFKPDVVVVSGYAFHLYPIIRALRDYGLVKRASVICTLDYIDLLYSDKSKDDLKSIAFTSPVCEIPGKVPAYQEWRKRFEAKFKAPPSYVDAYAYDTAGIVVKAYKATVKVDAASLIAATPFSGVVGEIKLDGDRDLSSTLVVGFFGEDGQIRLAD